MYASKVIRVKPVCLKYGFNVECAKKNFNFVLYLLITYSQEYVSC